MSTLLIYWTLNSQEEVFFLDSNIQFHRILRDGESVKGCAEAERRLAELLPHHRAVWVDTPEMLHRIAVEMKIGERSLDARPLIQIAAIVQRATPHQSRLNWQARMAIKLAEQYEQGKINQSCLMGKLVEGMNQQKANEEDQSGQSQHFIHFLYELVEAQLL